MVSARTPLSWLIAVICLFAALRFDAASAQSLVTIEDLVTVRDLDGLRISPDGEWAAIQVREPDPSANRYRQAWLVVATRGGNVRRVGDAGDPIQPAVLGRTNGSIRAPPPQWSPDSLWIAYVREESGRTQVWRSRVDGGGSEQLSHNESDVRVIAYSKDGRRLLFETELSRAQLDAAWAGEGRSGFRFDHRFFPSHSSHPVLLARADPDAGTGALHAEAPRGAQGIWTYDFAEGRERPATLAEHHEFAALTASPRPLDRPHFRDHAALSFGGSLAWTEAIHSERKGGMAPLTLAAQAPGADEPVVCTAPECSAQSIRGLWWRRESEIIFARGDGPFFEETSLYAWRPGNTRVRLILRTSDRFTSSEWNCGIAQDRLVCLYERPDYPRQLASIDLSTGAIEILHDPNPHFEHLDLGPTPQRMAFPSPLNAGTFGYLVLPPHHRAGERLPLVVVTYRCHGFLRGGTGDEYPIYAFAAEGFAVLCLNASEPEYDRPAVMDWRTYQQWSRGPGDPTKRRIQHSVDAAVAQLDAIGVIDIHRVGLTGLSFGAEIVSYALFNMPHLATAIASGPEIGPSSTFLYSHAGRKSLTEWGLESPLSDRWNALSVSRNAERVRAPLLLNVSDHELLLALESTAALEEAGRAVEMYVFPDEYHIKWQPAHRLAIYNRNIDWMNFWLRGVEDPASAKAEQYNRWRAMRVKQCELFKGDDAPWYCRQ